MQSLKGYNSKPEAKLAEKIKSFLEDKGWTVLNVHGNLFQRGLPDKYCFHQTYKQRWIEVKVQEKYKFTSAQLIYFPLIDRCGVGIWILTAATEDEYAKLFSKPNWKNYLHPSDKKKIQERYEWFNTS